MWTQRPRRQEGVTLAALPRLGKQERSAALEAAIEDGDARLVRALLAGLDISVNDPLPFTGRPPLHTAGGAGVVRASFAGEGRERLQRDLIRKLEDAGGSVLEALLEAPGVDVNALSSGFAPLHFYAAYGTPANVARLLAAPGIDVNLRGYLGSTPLHNVFGPPTPAREAETLRLLLTAPGVRPGVRDAFGRTPLHIAAQHNSVGGVRALMRVSNANARDADGNTPLDIALRHGSEACVQVLADAA